MVSSTFNISEFINKVQSYGYQDLIYTAETEATAAERLLYRHRHATSRNQQLRVYSKALKDIILYLRHGIKTRSLRQVELHCLNHVRADH